VIAQASMEFRPFTSFTVQLASKFTGRQFMDNTSREDRSLDPFWVQDLRVQYVLHGKWYRECQFIVQVNNLLNTKYEPNGYTYSYMYNGQLNTENYYYPMAGTQWMAGINLRF
jgi:iron complex outermembrane receptor protein